MPWGEGRVFKRGHIYWLAYYCDGEEIRESAKTKDLKAARALLHERVASARRGTLAPRESGLTYEDLEAEIVRDYEVNARKSRSRLPYAFAHLRPFFKNVRANRITTSLVRQYILLRKSEKAANATINIELAALGRMLRLAQQDERLSVVPSIPMLVVRNARQGFTDHATFTSIVRHLNPELARLVTFYYYSAWRLNEALTLQWKDIDWTHGAIVLRREHSKNGRPRTLPLRGEVGKVIDEARAARRMECVYVFQYVRHGASIPVGRTYLYTHWRRACREAGKPGLLIHDLRRSCIRNLIRAGVPQSVVMALSGHLTDAVFRRYDIVSDQDLQSAQDRLDAFLTLQAPPAHAQNTDN